MGGVVGLRELPVVLAVELEDGGGEDEAVGALGVVVMFLVRVLGSRDGVVAVVVSVGV